MTPTQQAVIDAAKKWAESRAAFRRKNSHANWNEYQESKEDLSEAVRLLEEEERRETT